MNLYLRVACGYACALAVLPGTAYAQQLPSLTAAAANRPS